MNVAAKIPGAAVKIISGEVIAKVEIKLNLQFPRVMKHGNDPNPISISNGGRQQSKINCINS
jgi:hypothetical protein